MAQMIMYVQIAFSVVRASTLREATEDGVFASHPASRVLFLLELLTDHPLPQRRRGGEGGARALSSHQTEDGSVFCRHGNPPLSQHDNLAIRQLASAPPTDPWQAICLTEKGLKKCAAFVPKQDTDAGCLFSFSHNARTRRIKDTTIGPG